MSFSNTPYVTFILSGSTINIVTAAVDTGCSETIFMSETVADSMGLIRTNLTQDLTIASGETHTFKIYLGLVLFDGIKKVIPIYATEKLNKILAGNKFLEEFGLRIQIISDYSK